MRVLHRHLPKRHETNITPKVDLYLSRLSHLSQIGLLIVATFGYFYTVVPLYEKSLLDEQIAQKELELKASKKALEENYKQLRKDIVSSYVFHVGIVCSGLDEKPEGPLQPGEKPLSPTKRYGQVFELDVSNCLTRRLEGSKNLSKILRKNDLSYLYQQVGVIGKEIENLRLVAQKEFNAFPQKATSNPEILEPLVLDSFSFRTLQALKGHISNSDYQIAVFEAQLNQGLSKIANQYRTSIWNEVMKLDEITWPQPPQ